MAPTLLLVVTAWVMMASRIYCVPANTQQIPSSPMLPGVLSRDQSLPSNMILPTDAMPTDLLVGVNGVGSHATPVAMNGGTSMAGPSKIQPDMSKAGQYPAAPNSMSATGLATQKQINSQGSFGQGFQNAVDRGQNGYPTGNNPPMAEPKTNMYPGPNGNNPPIVGPPMNMYPRQMMPSLPANMVLMNIQMACQSLQRFVMATPMAKEIMTSVANMNNMVDLFRKNTQCGMSALSASLRMFLKTCNLFTSCPNPAYFPAVPYMVQSPKPKSTGEPVKPIVLKSLKNLPVTNKYPKMRPPYKPRVSPVVQMFQSLMYGFRPQHINNRGGQTTQANATQEANGASDD